MTKIRDTDDDESHCSNWVSCMTKEQAWGASVFDDQSSDDISVRMLQVLNCEGSRIRDVARRKFCRAFDEEKEEG